MKVVTNDYKAEIKKFGRQIDILIQYTDENDLPVKIGNENINSIDLHYDGNILKSVMKQLDIDCKVEIPKGTLIRYRFGVKVRDSEIYLIDYRQDYDYAEMGYYIVDKVEKLEDTNSYKITCYDKMLYSMVEYNNTGITYPITVRDYITAICNKMGVTFTHSSGTFTNYNQNITEEPYLDENGNSLGYTFRDVLDEMAEITGSTLCINDSGNLEIKYITNSGVTITEDEIKNINVNFGEKYTVDVDIDAQVLNYMDRQTVLTNVYNAIDGIEYYLNDFESTGITYLNICDRYNVQIGDTTYSCVMLSDDINQTSGLKETIYTEKPEDTEEEYTYVNDTDKAVRKATIILNEKIGEVDIRGKTINLTADDIAISSTKFSVDKNGVISATGGTIGGWTLSNSRLYNVIPNDDNTKRVVLDSGSEGYDYAMWAGGPYPSASPFWINRSGEIYAQNATIEGTVTASAGKIGNWNIGNQTATGEKWGGTAVPNNTIASIYNTTGPALIQLKNGATGAGYCGMKSTDGSFLYAGASTSCNQSNDAKFKVSHTGALTSTSGSIGGFTIGNSHLQRTTANGNVGIGTDIYGNTPALYVEDGTGDNWAVVTPSGGYTNGTWSGASLEKHKKNFTKLENATDIIKNIDIYEYNLKQEKDTDKKHIGFVIGDKYNYSPKVTNKENNGYDLYSFVSVCCKAIQEQQEEIELLKEEIKKLKKEN